MFDLIVLLAITVLVMLASAFTFVTAVVHAVGQPWSDAAKTLTVSVLLTAFMVWAAGLLYWCITTSINIIANLPL